MVEREALQGSSAHADTAPAIVTYRAGVPVVAEHAAAIVDDSVAIVVDVVAADLGAREDFADTGPPREAIRSTSAKARLAGSADIRSAFTVIA